MPKFREADREVEDLVARVIKRHFPELHEASVSVACLFAFNGQLKHHGLPARATIRINAQDRRSEGCCDCTIKIDERLWKEMSAARQEALIDHELCHLIVKREDGVIQEDDCGRPVLKMRQHDYVCEGFAQTARRHGEDSFEVIDARAWHAEYEQLLLWPEAQKATA